MTRLIIPFLVALLVSGPAWGKDKAGRFHVFGEGIKKCTEYLGAYGASDLEALGETRITTSKELGTYLGWIQGYTFRANETELGATNIYGMNTIEMAGWLASWCRDNPSKMILDAVSAITESHLRK